MSKILKYVKTSFYALCLITGTYTCGWAEDAARTSVTDLVTQIQSVVKANGTQDLYKPILLKYLDFDEISRRVLDGVRKQIKMNENARAAKKAIDDFLPKFIPVFTDYIIKKYSKPEITEKFKNMDFEMNRASDNGKYYSVNTTFKSKSGTAGDVKVEWKTLNGKVVDMIFSDASASFFKNEGSEATAKYKQAGNNLNELLKQYN